MPIAGNVAVIGSGATRFGVHHERGYHDLLREAALAAIADSGVTKDEIGAAWLSTAVPDLVSLEGDSGTPVTEIGWVMKGRGVALLDADGKPIKVAKKGWRHF